MAVVADLEGLVAEGVLTPAQADILRSRSRAAMVTMAVNVLLAGGVMAAAGGLVVWLADAVTVAAGGLSLLVAGLLVLLRGDALWRIFGHAAALIGAGMLLGGGGLEAMERLGDLPAAWIFVVAGFALAGLTRAAMLHSDARLGFVLGALLLAGVALHLTGAHLVLSELGVGELPRAAVNLYSALLIALTGWAMDLRIVTALAIVPFAQMLDTSTGYAHAVYAFYSPEPSLSILQMTLAIAGCLWLAARWPGRIARHAGIFAVLAFVIGNLCFLVGSLWGDTIGEHAATIRARAELAGDWSAIRDRIDAYRERAITIPAGVFAAVWAIVLAACAVWAARGLRRGLFNTAMTFGAIHAYTQLFESFGDQPLAWVVGGLAAIPLAWGLWRLDQGFMASR